MIKVSVREFKAKLSYYLTLLESGESIEVRGMVLSTMVENVIKSLSVDHPDTYEGGFKVQITDKLVVPVEEKCDRGVDDVKKTAMENLREKVKDIENNGGVIGEGSVAVAIGNGPVLADFIPCDLCSRISDYTFWEDGDEKYVCDGCVRIKFGKGADRVIKGYNKL